MNAPQESAVPPMQIFLAAKNLECRWINPELGIDRMGAAGMRQYQYYVARERKEGFK
jgi:hypothetical protein